MLRARVDHVPALAAALLAAALVSSCASTTERLNLPPLEAVKQVNLERYLGTWFEIASYPQRFQAGCLGTTATYVKADDGQIDVINRCRKDSFSGPEDVARGKARVKDPSTNAKLEVSFFGPFWADYWIIDLAPDYSYAVVGHPGRDYLWILSRKPEMDTVTYAAILQRLDKQRYDVSKLKKTLHEK